MESDYTTRDFSKKENIGRWCDTYTDFIKMIPNLSYDEICEIGFIIQDEIEKRGI